MDPSGLIMIALVFGVFYFLVWRPQQKEQQRRDKFIGALKKGDEVVTGSGLIGTVSQVRDKTALIEIAKGTRVEVIKGTLQGSKEQVLLGNNQPSGGLLGGASAGQTDGEDADDEIEEADFEEIEASTKTTVKKKKKKESEAW